mmetsp:Transcript_30812/g.89033  ORF Transcript_30812/g.89033 Transcript_30812/m.89033 type:complete len:381 (+) Transcript_30812:2783-3925(+)
MSSTALTSTSGRDSKNAESSLWPSPTAYINAVFPRMSVLFKLGGALLADVANRPPFVSINFRTPSVSPDTAASSKLRIFINLGMRTTPSEPKSLSNSFGSATMILPLGEINEIQPVIVGAAIRTRYLSVGCNSATVTMVPGFNFAFTSLVSHLSVYTSVVCLISYLTQASGSRMVEHEAGRHFWTSNSSNIVLLLTQPSFDPEMTLSLLPRTSITLSIVSGSKFAIASLSTSSSRRRMTGATVTALSPGRNSLQAIIKVAEALEAELLRRPVNFENNTLDAEVRLAFEPREDLEEELPTLDVSQLSPLASWLDDCCSVGILEDERDRLREPAKREMRPCLSALDVVLLVLSRLTPTISPPIAIAARKPPNAGNEMPAARP